MVLLLKHLIEFAFSGSHDIQYNADIYFFVPPSVKKILKIIPCQPAVNISVLVDIYTAKETVICILCHMLHFLPFMFIAV